MDRLRKSENIQVNIEKDCINIDKDAQATQMKIIPILILIFLTYTFLVGCVYF